MSVSAIYDKGSRAIFGRGGGVIVNLTTQQEIPFERRGGVYTLGIWIREGDKQAEATVGSSAAPSGTTPAVFSRR